MSNLFDVTKLNSILGLNEHYNDWLLDEPDMEITKQQYETFVSGTSADEVNELTQDAKEKIKQLSVKNLKDLFNFTQIDTYNSLVLHYENSKEILNKYKDENDSMEQQLKNQTNNILTNERKTFYEDQQNDQLNTYYYYILWTVYAVIVFLFGRFSLTYPSTYSWKFRAFMFLLFLVLPIISPWILGKIIQLLHWIYNILPKNVYYSHYPSTSTYYSLSVPHPKLNGYLYRNRYRIRK